MRDAVSLSRRVYGSGHRGVQSDGQALALKQHKLVNAQQDNELCSEVEVLSCDQGRNVVMLIRKPVPEYLLRILPFWSNVFVETALVYAYLKLGLVNLVRKVFDEILDGKLVIWNMIILGNSGGRCGVETNWVVNEMRRIGFEVDCYIVVSLVSACSRASYTYSGDNIHCLAIRVRIVTDPLVKTSLLQLCVTVLRIKEAYMVFNEIYGKKFELDIEFFDGVVFILTRPVFEIEKEKQKSEGAAAIILDGLSDLQIGSDVMCSVGVKRLPAKPPDGGYYVDNSSRVGTTTERKNYVTLQEMLEVKRDLLEVIRKNYGLQQFPSIDGYDYSGGSNVLKVLGHFSVVGLLRVHYLLGNYSTGLKCLQPISISHEGVYTNVIGSYIPTIHHYAVASLMLRRYADGIREFNTILSYIYKIKQHRQGSNLVYADFGFKNNWKEFMGEIDSEEDGWKASSRLVNWSSSFRFGNGLMWSSFDFAVMLFSKCKVVALQEVKDNKIDHNVVDLAVDFMCNSLGLISDPCHMLFGLRFCQDMQMLLFWDPGGSTDRVGGISRGYWIIKKF